ncbi:Sulfate permease, MFS superfamily [Polaribacter sp. KT25b]|uniref:SulP family inorganic anion transporter n=1 Tax=Polaribacter sp. KT25b TaxID=1855336 RepID=UPI00087B76B9|nr:SulP family inorganic anion transporter [Polaribacter sp. KT25b]SDS56505.1 Sulfate permease, MFS superfamily [Polaribacter sp. KT25b]
MFKNIKNDLPSSIVVFFVALPLCLGIALASGAPLFSGVIAGIIGGVIVGSLSGSKLGVSGPAAGLAAIVLSAIATLGSYENFLVAVVLAGIIQLIFGFLKAGVIGYYFPSSVIKGMLTGIGIIIILKQIPHFFGYDAEPEGAESFIEASGENTFSSLFNIFDHLILGSLVIGVLGLAVILFWDLVLAKKAKFFTIIQGPLIAVVLGIAFFMITGSNESLAISQSHLVSVPIPEDINSFLNQFSFPNFSAITNPEVWIVAFTIALVASLETLLSVEACDKLDPDKNVTPTNRELLAQGTGNIVSGLIGGLPITQVIVRSSANVQSGGKSKLSTIIHGFLLLISVILIPTLLNKIPLSVLAAILLVVGYKLAKPKLFKQMYQLGWKQFVPFIVTIIGIVFTDLLVGIGLGLAVGIVVILLKSYQNSHFLHIEDNSNGKHKIKMTLAEEVTFFNKGAILKELDSLPRDTQLEINLIKTRYLDNDIIEILEDFLFKAKERNIDIKLISKRGIVDKPASFIHFFNERPKSDLSLS